MTIYKEFHATVQSIERKADLFAQGTRLGLSDIERDRFEEISLRLDVIEYDERTFVSCAIEYGLLQLELFWLTGGFLGYSAGALGISGKTPSEAAVILADIAL